MSQQCPHCRLAVQDGDTFCGECGGVLVLRLPGQGNDIYQTLRYDSIRATIAAMYDCTLEGVDAALRTTGAEPRPAPVAVMTGVPG